MDLHKTTLETVEIAINTQAQIVNDLVSTNPGERSQAANGAAALLDKMVSLKAAEDSREVNQIKAEIEENKYQLSMRKLQQIGFKLKWMRRRSRRKRESK